MCVKDKLQEYLWINRNIEQLENELLVIESRVMKVTPTLSDLPKMKGYNDTLAENVGKMIELQNIINKNLNKLYGLKVEIETLINKLPTREQYLVRARYMEKKTWEQIAVEMCYNWKYIHELHSKALNLMSEYKTSD